MTEHVQLPILYPGRSQALGVFTRLKLFDLWYKRNDNDAQFIRQYGMCDESVERYSDIVRRYVRESYDNRLRVVRCVYGEMYIVWRREPYETMTGRWTSSSPPIQQIRRRNNT
jgi:hypothetical protein